MHRIIHPRPLFVNIRKTFFRETWIFSTSQRHFRAMIYAIFAYIFIFFHTPKAFMPHFPSKVPCITSLYRGCFVANPDFTAGAAASSPNSGMQDLDILSESIQKVRRGFHPRRTALAADYFFRNSLLRNRMTFITTRKRHSRIIVSTGFTGASVASSMIGKPNTMAGKFW